MSLSKNVLVKKEKRKVERFKSSIPALIQKNGVAGTCECTLLNISLNGFATRIENGKFNFSLDEEFFLIIDPKLFDIEELNKIQINSICTRLEPSVLILGAIFSENTEIINESIRLIVNCFKKINENDY